MSPRDGTEPGSRHGEYKVPGGKLVVIDLDVTGGKLSNVMLSGDFFLEPPEALDHITAALEGLPADAEPELMATRIQENLPAGAALIGFSAEAVAIAVERALS